jgi:hypothetical protein
VARFYSGVDTRLFFTSLISEILETLASPLKEMVDFLMMMLSA